MTGINKTGVLYSKIFLISLVAVIAACDLGTDDKELMERAKGYVETRDLNAATLELKNLLRNDANNAEARYLLGKINLTLGDAKTAHKQLSRALDAGWDEAAVYVLLAEVLLRQGEYQAILDDIPIKDSYAKETRAELLGLWAAAEMGLGQWEEAEKTIETGEAINRQSKWVMQSRTRQLVNSGDLQAASQTLSDALEVHPNSQDLWLLKAGLARESGKFEIANEALQKIIDLDPLKDISAWGRQARLNQGQMWLQQQDFARAREAVLPVLRTYPGDPLANYLEALVAFKLGEYDRSEERLLLALQVAPEHRPSLMLFGALNYARSDFQQAAYYLEKASASRPEDLGAQTLLGRTYLMLGQYDEAENRLKFASSRTGDNAELLALIGLSKLMGGNMQAGIQELEKAAAAAPTDTAIRSELARAYLSAGDTGRAIEELESALDGSDQQHQTEALLVLAYLRAGEFDKALELADKLAKQLPNSHLPRNLAGVAYEGTQDLPMARSMYNQSLGIVPGNIMAQLGLARLDLNEGKVDAARSRYQSALETHPTNAAVMVALAKLYVQEGEAKQALDLLEKARTTDEKALEPRLILSKYYLNEGQAEKALVYANEALKASPQSSLALLAAGQAQLAAGKLVAVQTLTNLAESLPGSPNVHYYLAEAQARFGDMAGTRRSLQKVLVLQSDHRLAMRALGRLELREGDTEAALKISNSLKEKFPEAVTGYVLEGDVLMAKKETKAALKAYQAVPVNAKDSEVVLKISRAHRVLGDTTASYGVLREWLEQYPDELTVHFALALQYMADGKKDSAISHYEQVLERQPENPAVLNDLAWLYYERGDKNALELAEKAYRIDPDNPAIQDTYGWILVQTGKVESGLIALEQAISNLPNSLDIRYHFAAALARAGDKARAREELNLALQSDKPFSERASAEALQKELR